MKDERSINVRRVGKVEKYKMKEDKGVVKMEKERKEEKEVKGVKNMSDKKEVKGVKNMSDKKEVKGVKNMEKKIEKKTKKELVEEIETKKMLLAEKVIRWAQGLCPIKDLHIKEKGRYYPLIEKESGKICLIDKVQGKKIPFKTLEDQNMKFVIVTILAERKEEIEKEVEEGKRKYLEGKLEEIDELLSKF